MVGLTLGYAAFVCNGHRTNPRLLRHEFRHVCQYETAGSISAFLPIYLGQIVQFGYQDAPFEQNACTCPRSMFLCSTRWLPKFGNTARPTGARLCHNASMTTILFRIIQQDLSYAIEVTKGDVAPYTVSGFKTAAEAEAWVADRQFATKVGDRWERLPDPDRRY